MPAVPPRAELTISTKIALAGSEPGKPIRPIRGDDISKAVDFSLKRLQIEYLDVMLIAVAGPEYFEVVVDEHMPVLQRLQRAGKTRFLGSSELSRDDGSHEWLQRFLPLFHR